MRNCRPIHQATLFNRLYNMDINAISGVDEPEDMQAILQELQDKLTQERQDKLDKLGETIAKRRDEAVAARRESGFEKQWQEDEEYYEGIDDLNRNTNQYIKPRSDSGGLQLKKINVSETQCIEFLNVTRPFVDAAAARMGDILIPANDWNFSIKPVTDPEFEANKDNQTPMIIDPSTGKPFTVSDAIAAHNQEVAQKVAKAEQTIKDWLIACNYKAETRKVIDGAAMIGTGILKGPYPDKQISKELKGNVLQITEQVCPTSKRIDHWDFYPDMNCGENIQDGEYVIERSYLNARQLAGLKGMPESGYIDSAIDKVIKEGPGRRNADSNKSDKITHEDDRFEVWYYYGTIKSSDLKELDDDYAESCEDDQQSGETYINAIIVLVNDTVIKGIKNPLDNAGYPFDVMVWKRVPGKPFGIGVAREGRVAQKTVLASFRTLMENMGLASVPMIALLRSAIEPADGDWTLRKGKQWIIKEDSGITNINQAIQTVVVPAMQKELTALLELGMKMMEDSTGVTFLMQGQQGSAPDTVGGMQMMLRSSSTVLRREARIYDENITEPHIKRYYNWLLMYGNDDEKGELQIEASGSSSLAEHEIQASQLPQIIQMAMNPVFGKSPKKALDEFLKALRFDPTKFDMDEAEKQQLSRHTDPRIQIEQIRTQKDLQISQSKLQVESQKIKSDQDRDAVFAQGVTNRDQMAYQADMAKLQLQKDLAMLQYANQHQLTLENIKAKLADSAMRLRTEKELASLDATEKNQAISPPVEVPGKAPAGHSFQQV